MTAPGWRGTLRGRIGQSTRPDQAQQRSRCERYGFVAALYLSSRALLLIVATVDGALQHVSLLAEFTNWDGYWYLRLAANGYPRHPSHLQTTLGFFPLYPMVMWLAAHALSCSLAVAGLLVAGVGGFVAAVLVARLSEQWWGARSSRRAVAFFCYFPGSVVFSMTYSEGLLIPLAVGALLALQRRRWLLAGALAALATACGPQGLAIVPACAISAWCVCRRSGSSSRERLGAIGAAVLAPVGVLGFATFLWIWTGTPFASLDAQRYGWGERTSPFALVHQARRLASEISFHHFDAHHEINLNLVAGLLGAIVLVVGIVLLLRSSHPIGAVALAWTLGVGVLAVTSENTPPNPRLLITAFPAVLVLVRALTRRAFVTLMLIDAALLALLSALTYVGSALRP